MACRSDPHNIIADKADYYRVQLDITRTAIWKQWVNFILQAVEESANSKTAKIAALRTLAEHNTAHMRERLPKNHTRELVDVIFEQPYFRIGNLVKKNIAQRQSASRYLKELTAIGVLREVQEDKAKIAAHKCATPCLMPNCAT